MMFCELHRTYNSGVATRCNLKHVEDKVVGMIVLISARDPKALRTTWYSRAGLEAIYVDI